MVEAFEPAVRQEDFLTLLKQYVPTEKITYEQDIVSKRYRLLMNQPIVELGSPFAKAYDVRDSKDANAALYALVYDSTIPTRQKNIRVLKAMRHPNLLSVIDDGVVEISTLAQARYVVILEKPIGESLAQLLSVRRPPVPESMIIDFLLRPLTDILVSFFEAGISHNRINLHNIFIRGNQIVLGECISEPSGYSQDPICETLERLQTNPLAKQDFQISADCYALAVVALHMAIGFQPYAGMDKERLIREMLTKGVYHVLALQWDLPEALQDLLRGLLNDSYRDRRDPYSLQTWLSGKHFHLISPSIPRETSRGFELVRIQHFNSRSIAHTVFNNWDDSRILLYDHKITRWLENSALKPEMAAQVERAVLNSGPNNPRFERQNNEVLSRIISILDPLGPIRIKNLAVTPEGVGLLFSQALLKDKREDLASIVQILENDLLASVIDTKSAADNAVYAKLQRVRSFVRIHSLGFGPERCLYEFHPQLPCQSPLLKRYYITTIPQLLVALDGLAGEHAAKEAFIDRHIAAFIANRLDIVNEISMPELDRVPELAGNTNLTALKLLVRAQTEVPDQSLKGLSYWVALRLLPVLDAIHRRSLRKKLQGDLRKSSATGLLQSMASTFLNPRVFVADHMEFRKASNEYTIRKAQISELKNQTHFSRHARVAGRAVAQSVAYSICMASIYFSLRSLFQW